MQPGLEPLQERLGYRFTDVSLLERALTHRSVGPQHNERLEFLGDAALNLSVSLLLYERCAQSPEGELTRVRAHLVREASLHQVAAGLGLARVLRLSEGEQRSGGAQRASTLADALEAVIGAVSLDGGFPAAHGVVVRLFGEVIHTSEVGNWRKDAKTELQEWLQARRMPVPGYRIAATSGQAHDQTFEIACEVPALSLSATGSGRSRRAAEQEAARRLLEQIRQVQA
jgi:ribonuclease-3